MRWIIAILLGFSSFAAWGSCSYPLPTQPRGPTWTTRIEAVDLSTLIYSAAANVTVWRQPCAEGGNLLLATFEPTKGEPFICSANFNVIQNGRWYDNVTLSLDPTPYSVNFCDGVLSKITFNLGLFASGGPTVDWDINSEFTLVYERYQSNQRLAVGAYNPADYGQPTGPKALHGSLSGSWYDPSRDGEGFALEFGEAGGSPIGTLYWFTYKNGKAYWLAGASNYRAGQSKITFDLIEFRGTGFGAQFKPNNVLYQEVGTISLEFDSCQSGRATWRMDNGETGSFNLRRITTGIHGVPCQ